MSRSATSANTSAQAAAAAQGSSSSSSSSETVSASVSAAVSAVQFNGRGVSPPPSSLPGHSSSATHEVYYCAEWMLTIRAAMLCSLCDAVDVHFAALSSTHVGGCCSC
jgi:hypothetical protein